MKARGVSFSVADLVAARRSGRQPFVYAYVVAVGPGRITVRPANGWPFTIYFKQRGRVRHLTDAEMLEARRLMKRAEAAQAPAFADEAGTPRIVYAGPAALRPVPPPRTMVRSEAFKRFVCTFACISCRRPHRDVDPHHEGERGIGQKTHDLLCVPLCQGPGGCHGFYEDKNHFPGRTVEQTRRAIAEAIISLLVEWHIVLMELVADPEELEALSAQEQALCESLRVPPLSVEEVPHVA